MKKCKSCQKEIDNKAKKCPYCQTDQRNWFRRHPILTGILVLVVIGIIGSARGANKNTNSTTNNSSSTASSKTQQTEQNQPTPTTDPNPNFGDGTHVVGKDIQPGTYRTRTGSSGCYYSRLSGFSGELSEIITNENTDYPAVIAIGATDKGFKSSRCGKWTQDLSQITNSTTTFNDGVYIVGTDIQPGTYKSSGQGSCYYSRLAGFGGQLGDIISNENTDTAAIVTIAATDKGFKSSRCGTWTLQ
jgi:hypothetical protein